MRQEQQKLIPAIADDGVRTANAVAHHANGGFQHLIARLMPIRFVACLEAVHVQDGNTSFHAAILQGILIIAAIIQPGQRVAVELFAHAAGLGEHLSALHHGFGGILLQVLYELQHAGFAVHLDIAGENLLCPLRGNVECSELSLFVQHAAFKFGALGMRLRCVQNGLFVQQAHAGERLPEARHLDFRFFARHFDLCCHGSPSPGYSFRPSILQGDNK